MTAAALIQTSFNAGELSPRMEARPDLHLYRSGASELFNMLPTVQGPAVKRSGTRHLGPLAGPCRLVPFRFSVGQAYVIEMGDRTAAVWTQGQRVASGIATPWSADELDGLDWAQSRDVLYLVHRQHAPMRLVRTGPQTFALAPLELKNGPLGEPNTDEARTLSASNTTGIVTLTASVPLFLAGYEGTFVEIGARDFRSVPAWEPNAEIAAAGALRRSDGKVYEAVQLPPSGSKRTGVERPVHDEGEAWDGGGLGKDYNDKNAGGVLWRFVHGRAGLARIVSVISPTSASAEVVRRLPGDLSAGSWRWALGAFSGAAGWPEAVAVREERLWLAAGPALHASAAGDLEDFAALDASGLPQADLAIRRRVAEPEAVRWLMNDRALLVGTAGGEHAVAPVNAAAGIAFNNVEVRHQGFHGSARVKPVAAGSTVLFVARGGRKLRAVDYVFDRDRYVAADVTVRAEHVTAAGIRAMAATMAPEGIVWLALADGGLAALTWDEEQEVRGFSRHALGGGGHVESLAAIPSESGGDELWLAVRRGEARTMERLTELWRPGTSPAEAMFLDCAMTYRGPPVRAVSGLDPLAERTVQLLADGATHPDRTVDRHGRIELERPASIVHVGLAFDARVTTMRLVVERDAGPVQHALGRVTKLGVGLLESAGVRVRQPGGRNETILTRTSAHAMDRPPPLFTGEVMLGFPGQFDRGQRVTVESWQPLPFTLTGLAPRVSEGQA